MANVRVASTKPWNVQMGTAADDERLYTDFKEADTTTATNMKFKTSTIRMKFWVLAHKEVFKRPYKKDFQIKTGGAAI